MKCILMNFGDNTRVVHDIHQQAIVINIGATQAVDLDPMIYDLLKKAMETSDPLVLVQDGIKHPPELLELMALLSLIDEAPYEELLSRVRALIGAENIETRPTRMMIRVKLRSIAAEFASGKREATSAEIKAVAASLKPVIQDDVNPADLESELENQELPISAPEREKPAKTHSEVDDALGVFKADPDDFDPASPETAVGAPKRAQPPKAAKGERTSRAGKASGKQKPASGRVRA